MWPNNGKVIEETEEYFVIAGPEGETSDCRIVGERVGYAGDWFADMDAIDDQLAEEAKKHEESKQPAQTEAP